MAVSPTLDSGLTPAPPGFEGNAPGLPQVDLPQVAAAPAPEPEPLANVTAPPVIEVGVPPDQATPGTATPDAATAPPVAPAPAPAPVATPAPEPAQAAPVGAPGDSFGPPEGETQVAGGLMELIQRLSRVTPDSMPRPRAQDFLDDDGERALGDAFAVHESLKGESALAFACGGDDGFSDFHDGRNNVGSGASRSNSPREKLRWLLLNRHLQKSTLPS